MRSNAWYVVLVVSLAVQASSPPLLERRYKEGEKLTYRMHGLNGDWKYEIQANGLISKDSKGAFVEEYGWTGMTGVDLNPASLAFRQRLSLNPDFTLTVPDLSKVQPQMIGPITDLLTFYADMQVAKRAALTHSGEHSYFKHGTPNSWADGTYYVLGQDSIDFDVTLTKLDRDKNTEDLLVKHVPPEKPQVSLSAEWMRKPVSDTPNNWVEVAHQNGKYIAEVGKETFDDKIVVDLTDGKILTAELQNPVEFVKRECTDAELANCAEPSPGKTFRRVGIELVK